MSKEFVAKKLSVSDIVRELQSGQRPAGGLSLEPNYCKRHGLESESKLLPFYVEPHITEFAAPLGSSWPVYLISAPAAVGKSTLARRIQYLLRDSGKIVVYIPLQKATIGEHFFSGLLSGLFPNSSRKEILSSLFSGSLILIFDGYDEVSMTSNQIELNKIFTTEIAESINEYQQFNKSVAQPCILFLFRSVFFETGIFEPLLQCARQVKVEFFDNQQQNEYLNSYLTSQQNHNQSFEHLIKSLLSAFEHKLSAASAEASAFFGHAIVLSAFGDYVLDQAELNTFKFSQELSEKELDEKASVEILKKIITTILKREVTKFPDGIRRKLSDDNIYSEVLQESLLSNLAYELASGTEISHLEGIYQEVIDNTLTHNSAYAKLSPEQQEQVRQEYSEELKKKFDHHPFIDLNSQGKLAFRNPIYFEYYLAKYIADHHLVEPATVFFSNNRSSQYSALFFLSFLPGRDLKSHASMIYYIAHLLSMSSGSEDYQFKLLWDETNKRWVGQFESEDVRMEEFYISDSVLVVSVPDNGVLQNFEIAAYHNENTDILSPGSAVTFVGTNKHRDSSITLRNGLIASELLEIDAPRISIDALSIHCDELMLSDSVHKLEGVSTLHLCAKHNPQVKSHRWAGLLRNACAPSKDEITDFRQKLGNILLWFRKHGRPDYGVYKKRFNTVAMSKGASQDYVSLVDFLYNRGVLTDRQALVILNQEILQAYGIYYRQQNALEFKGDKPKELLTAWKNFRSHH